MDTESIEPRLCNKIRPGTLGFQQCIKPAGHERDRHRSQDRQTWGTAPELPGCIECGMTDIEDPAEHEKQTGHAQVPDEGSDEQLLG